MPDHEVKESSRAKSMRVAVYLDGSVVVTKPKHASLAAVERFVRTRHAWIEDAQEKMRARAAKALKHPKVQLPRLRRGTKPYKDAVTQARKIVTERVQHWSHVYGFSYGTITIRNQTSRWGSCTKAGNLSFNFRLGFLPPELLDYVVIHELCHTQEHNHSMRFWSLVAQQMPDHLMLRKRLRSYVF